MLKKSDRGNSIRADMVGYTMLKSRSTMYYNFKISALFITNLTILTCSMAKK